MKIIKYILILFGLCLANTSYAQLYLKGYTGYSFSTNPTKVENIAYVINATFKETNESSATNPFPIWGEIESSTRTFSLFHTNINHGEGVNLGLGLGYKFTSNLSVELDVSTQLFSINKINNDWNKYSSDNSVTIEYHIYGISGNNKYCYTNIQVAPALVYGIEQNKWSPYIKAGLNIIHTRLTKISEYDFGSSEIEEKITLNGGLNIGFRGSLGITYNINEKLSLYGEFTTVHTMYKFTDIKLNEYIVDGKNKTSEQNSPELNDEGLKVNYSHIGFNVGVKLKVGKKHKATKNI